MANSFKRSSALIVGLVAALCLVSCRNPKPESFTDAKTLPQHFVGRDYHAYASSNKLTIAVSQIPGLNVARIEASTVNGEIYLSPRRISSGGSGITQFDVDIEKYSLGADWPQHVYWLVEEYAYPITSPGFWSKSQRSPWIRKQVDVTVR